jgi:hypothetical protein
MRVTVREIVHPWQIGLAACAVAVPLVPVLASGDPFFVLPFVFATAVLTAVPLFLHSRPHAFRWVAGAVSAVLLPWSVFGSWVGMLVFLPSVPLLLLAAFADPRQYPKAAGFLAGAGCVSAVVVALFWWGRGY